MHLCLLLGAGALVAGSRRLVLPSCAHLCGSRLHRCAGARRPFLHRPHLWRPAGLADARARGARLAAAPVRDQPVGALAPVVPCALSAAGHRARADERRPWPRRDAVRAADVIRLLSRVRRVLGPRRLGLRSTTTRACRAPLRSRLGGGHGRAGSVADLRAAARRAPSSASRRPSRGLPRTRSYRKRSRRPSARPRTRFIRRASTLAPLSPRSPSPSRTPSAGAPDFLAVSATSLAACMLLVLVWPSRQSRAPGREAAAAVTPPRAQEPAAMAATAGGAASPFRRVLSVGSVRLLLAAVAVRFFAGFAIGAWTPPSTALPFLRIRASSRCGTPSSSLVEVASRPSLAECCATGSRAAGGLTARCSCLHRLAGRRAILGPRHAGPLLSHLNRRALLRVPRS